MSVCDETQSRASERHRDAMPAIGEYLAEGGLHRGVVYDACRDRLMEIGEAVKHIDATLLDQRPDVEWKQIARMRDVLVHHYHDTDFAVVEDRKSVV